MPSGAVGEYGRARPAAPAGAVPLWVLVLLAGPVQFATAAFLPALPSIAATFGVPTRTAQLGVVAYIAAYALGQLPAGTLSDRLGRRPVALSGIALYALAAAASAASGGIVTLIALRAAEGLGAGMLLVAGRAALRDGAAGARLTRAMALIGMWAWMLGGTAGLAAGLLLDARGWRATCLLTAGFGAAVGVVAALRLHETRGAASPPLSGYRPVLRARTFWRHAGAASAMIGAFYAFLTGGPAILIGRLGVPAAALGLFQLLAVAAFCVSALAAARLARRGAAIVAGGVALAFAGAALLLLAGATGHLSPAAVGACLVVLALGAGLVMPATLAGAVDDFPERAGAANAAAALLQTLGAGAGAALASLPGDPVLVVPAVMMALTLGAGLAHAGLAGTRRGA